MAGEGTRGGKIVGHTRSGKPIYASAHDRGHRAFTPTDHEDAHRLTGDKVHLEMAEKKRDAAKMWAGINKYHPDKKSFEGESIMKKGIRTTDQSLIHQDEQADREISKAIKEGRVSSHGLRKGGGDSPRERLERSIAPETTDITKSDALTSREREALRKSYGDENLKDTHGEQFHSDNDRAVEKEVTTIDEVKPFGESGQDGTAEERGKKKKKEAKKSIEPDQATLLSKALAEDTPAEDIGKSEATARGSTADSDEDVLDSLVKAIQPKLKPPMPSDKTAAEGANLNKKKLKKDDNITPAPPAPSSGQTLGDAIGYPKSMSPAKKSLGRNKFVKSIGPGGLIFDFGDETGNPIADQATRLLNANADPIQRSNAQYQQDAYKKALSEYVEKGANYQAEPFGNIQQDLDKGMDQQVREQHEREMAAKSGPAVKGEFNKSEITLGGEKIQATGETDATLIEEMKQQGHGGQVNKGEFIADMTKPANTEAPIPDATKPIPTDQGEKK